MKIRNRKIMFGLILVIFISPMLLKQLEVKAYRFHDKFLDEAYNAIGYLKDNSDFPSFNILFDELGDNYYAYDPMMLIKDGCWDEDHDDFTKKIDHAWDPYLKVGMFIPGIGYSDGAAWKCFEYFDDAINLHRDATTEEEIREAYRLLGHSIHMLQDVTVPYHAVSSMAMDGLTDYREEHLAGPHFDYEWLSQNLLDSVVYNYDFSSSEIGIPMRMDHLFTWSTSAGYGNNDELIGFHPACYVQDAALLSRDNWDFVEVYANSYDPDDGTTFPAPLVNKAKELIHYAYRLSVSFIFYFWMCVTDEYDDDNDPLTDKVVLDFDGDGLTAFQEYKYYECYKSNSGGQYYEYQFLNPFEADSDNDGLLDGDELELGYDPLDDDTDDNGFLDGDEDYDSDQLANYLEYIKNTELNNDDTDSDGLSDGDEVYGYYAPNNPAADSEGLVRCLEPTNPDYDLDNLLDGEEILTYNSHPGNPDTDNDGFIDGEEVHTYTTNPCLEDTDNDEINDRIEYYWWIDSWGQTSTSAINFINDLDSDNDGLADGIEKNIGLHPLENADYDSDGFTDAEEVLDHLTDPLDANSNIALATPSYCLNFKGLPSQVVSVAFSWNNPSNYYAGGNGYNPWIFVLKVRINYVWTTIYSGTSRYYTYNPPSATTGYYYRVYCVNPNTAPDSWSTYVTWYGKAKDSSGGGGPI